VIIVVAAAIAKAATDLGSNLLSGVSGGQVMAKAAGSSRPSGPAGYGGTARPPRRRDASTGHRAEASRPPTTSHKRKRSAMQFDKSTILDLLRQQGKNDQADQADQELPDRVDTDQHAGLLQRFGLDPNELLGRFTGGLPGS
jgi:hypothetical protein